MAVRAAASVKSNGTKAPARGRKAASPEASTPPKKEAITISKANLQVAEFTLTGTAPMVQNKFSEKAKQQIMETQAAGSQSRKGKKREPKDFNQLFIDAQHIADDGWNGLPAPAFRSAMIDACRLVGFKMTHAKLSVFILPDGFDKDDMTPLVKITKGKPRKHTGHVRNETGVVDIRSRPMWAPGWQAKLRVQFDADQFSTQDVANLLERAGLQVGIGEGRPNSKKSHGMGWGTFTAV